MDLPTGRVRVLPTGGRPAWLPGWGGEPVVLRRFAGDAPTQEDLWAMDWPPDGRRSAPPSTGIWSRPDALVSFANWPYDIWMLEGFDR